MASAQIERDVPAEPAVAYRWFVEPQLLIRWWPSEAETDPVPGGSYRLHWDGPGVTLCGEYTTVQPGERLAFTWSWEHDDLSPRAVDISFTRSESGTTVTVDHEAETDDEATDYRDGWTHFLDRLSDAIAAA